MSHARIILISVVLSILAAYGTVKLANTPQQATLATTPQKEESVYDRVMRTGVIRCGYYVWPPYMTKEANTAQVGGVFYDLMNAVGKSLSLKVEWTEEARLASFITGLQNHRYDAYCSAVGPLPARARETDFSIPLLYFPVQAFVRADDARFDGDITRADQPDVKLATQEGEATSILARTLFPNAKVLELTQLSLPGELFQNVADKKADLVLTDINTFNDYDKTNPGKIRRVALDAPISVVPFTIGIKRGEHDFRQMINWALLDLQNSGQAEMIYKKYNLDPQISPRPANGYK